MVMKKNKICGRTFLSSSVLFTKTKNVIDLTQINMIMKNAKKLLMLVTVGALSLLVGCKDEVSPTGTVNLTAKTSGTTSINTGRTEAAVVISDFQISIRDVIFKSDVDGDGVIDDSTDVAFRGPYQLDLLNGVDAISQSIGSVQVPNGVYTELRFKFHKDADLDVSHPLFDRSIFIAGTINGTPFEMWHDTSENLDIGKATGVSVNNNTVDLVINFTIEQFLSSVVTITLNDAVDGNADGLIEINPNDPDGNKNIADDLKTNVKGAADLLDL